MKPFPLLLAATLACGATPALAAHRNHDATPPAPAAGTTGPDGARADGCAKPMQRKDGKQPGDADGPSRHAAMHARMAQRHAAMAETILQPAVPPERLEALGLDAAQRERLAALEKRNRILQWTLLGELREERLALQGQLAAPEPDPSAATARLRAVQDVEARLFEARLAARREALDLLTPGQRERLLAPPGRHGQRPGAGGHDHAGAAGKPVPQDDAQDSDDDDDDPHAAHGGSAPEAVPRR